MKYFILTALSLAVFTAFGQTYNMTNTTTSTCSGTFYDSQGAGGNYNNSENLVHTFCPSIAGNKLRFNFTAFNTEASWDQLEIFDGNSVAAPSFGLYEGTPAVPFIVQATASNPTGCLTFRFKSDGITKRAGWAATISCFVPCQTINSNFVSSSPAPGGDGIIRACQGQSVTFTGSGTFSSSGTGATYLWDFGDGTTGAGITASHTYAAGGSYKANLKITDPNGCINYNLLNKFVYISTTPTLTTSAAPTTICQGQTSTLTGGVTMTPYVASCTPPVSGTTFLPDGSGVSYETSITVDCYNSGATITSANDFNNVCINMEHSYCGDVEIEFKCPNGQTIQLKPNAGGGTYLGAPIDNTTGGPGTGRLYCFTPVATQLFNGGPTSNAGTPANASINAGNYKPSQSFAGLVGCPLNGTWTIIVTDHLTFDDGYIFSWDFNLNASITTQGSFTPTIASQGWVANPALSGGTATTAVAAPTTLGSNCFTYSITDNFGCTYTKPQCITVTAGTVPTFTAIAARCQGSAAPVLPTTSNNGFTGTWSPATSTATAGTFTYTFTPTAGQCATTTTITVTITAPTVPAFNPIPAFCQGSAAPTLSTTSTNGITGTWSPATVSNTASGTYTFTPSAGQCATTASLAITVTPQTVPTFTAIPAFCQGGTAPALPGTSTNGIAGTWSPATISNMASGTYTFTPNAGVCATTASLSVTINMPVTPTFTAIPAFCQGTAAPTLPGSSNNGFTGTWSPATVSNTASGTYTFTPTAGQCATTASLSITVNPPTTPTFTAIPAFCQGTTAPSLPGTSNNSFTGTWSPATVSNTASGSYTFTPTAGQCATTASMSITVSPPPAPTFNPVGPFCEGAAISALPTSPTNDPSVTGTWSPAINNMATTTYTYTPAAGECSTTGSLTITINPPVVPTFTAIPPFCEGTTPAPTLAGTSNNGYTGAWAPGTVDNMASGTYTFTPTAGQCATTASLSVTVTPQTIPTFNPIPPLCGGASAPPLPTTSNNSITGTWNPAVIDNSTTGNYLFTPAAGQCASTLQITVTVGPPTAPVFDPITMCQGETPPALQNPSSNGVTGTWSPAVINPNSNVTYSFTPSAGLCATSTTFTVTLTPPTVPTFDPIPPFCEGTAAPSLSLGSTNSPSIFGSWNPAVISNTAGGTYTFTPNAGQCATTASLTVTLTPPNTPTFNPITPFCQGSTPVPSLPAASNEGYTGAWGPAVIDNMAPGTYTFTPDAGQCSTTGSISVTLAPDNPPTFAPIAPFCEGTAAPSLPATSNEGYTGSWNPAVIDNMASGTYTFTPDIGQCSTTGTLSVTITPPTVPTFDPVGPYCEGTAIPALPGTSNEGIAGTWSPGIDNMASGTYTFTPSAGECATTASLSITIDPPVPSTFNPIAPICAGDPAPVLPATSNEGFTGTWNPATVDNTATGTYMFTPDAGQCATTGSVTVTVGPPATPTFPPMGPFCEGESVPGLQVPSNEGIPGTWSPAVIDNTASGTYTFTPDAGVCAITASLSVTIDPRSPSTFDPILPFCAGAAAPTLPSTSNEGIAGTWSPATVDNMNSGTYTFTPDPLACATTGSITLTVDPLVTPTFTAIPLMCENDVPPVLENPSLNGITGTWDPSVISTSVSGTTTYTFTPDAGVCATTATLDAVVGAPEVPLFTPVGPFCEGDAVPVLSTTSDNAIVGTWTPAVIDNMASGTYTFLPDPGYCATTASLSVVVNTAVTPTFTQVDALCTSATAPSLPTTSNNGYFGFWNPPTVSIAAGGTTTYLFTPDAGQCATTASMDIIVNAAPTAAPETKLCDATGTTYTVTVVLSGGDASSYTFNEIAPGLGGSFSGDTWTSNAIPSGTAYEIELDDASGCGPILIQGIKNCDCLTDAGTMNTTPISLCEGDVATGVHNGDETLDPNDVFGYIIHDASGAILGTVFSSGSTPTFSFAAPMALETTYYISAIAGNNDGSGGVDLTDPCLSIAPGTPVVWHALPIATATNNSPVCPGENVQLDVNKIPGASYSWTGPNGFTSTSESPVLTAITAAEIGTYSVTITFNGCTSLPATTDVILNPLPTATPGSNSPICEGDDILLTAVAVGGATYDWTGPNGFVSTTQNPTLAAATAAEAGTYELVVTLNGCPSLPATVDVVVNPIPVVTAPDVSTCLNVPVNITAFGATTYDWTPSAGITPTMGSAVTADGSGPGTYTVTGTTAGCSASTTVSVTISTSLTISVTPSSATICAGGTVGLSASGGTNYTWTPSTGLDFDNVANVNASPGSTTTYTVEGETSGCIGTTTVTVTVTAPVVPTFASIPSVCEGSTAPALPTTSTNAITGTWSSAVSTATPGTTAYTFTPAAGQCASTTTLSVTVNAKTVPTFNPMPAVCQGASVANLPTTSLNGVPGTWSPGITTTNPGTYNYTFTPAVGQCATTAGNSLVVNAIPVISVPSVTTCPNVPVVLNASGGAGGTYTWSPTTGLSPTTGSSVTATIGTTTTYTVTNVNNGCTGTASATVTIASGLSITVDPSASTICDGDCVDLTAFGGTTYTWSPATGLNSTASQTVTACPTVTTTYTVTGNTSGCTGTATVVVTVNPLPVVSPASDIAVCAGDMIAVPAFSQPSVTWTNSDQNIGLAPSGVGNITSFMGMNAGSSPITAVITVIATANGCVGPPMTFNITVNPLPTVTAGVDQEVCEGTQVTINGGGAASYVWTPSAVDGQPFTPTVGLTSYSVEGTDGNGCKNTDVMNVTVNALPVVNAGPDQLVCAGTQVTLTATGGDAGSNYTWPAPIANGVPFTPAATQTYTVQVDDMNGCQDTDDVTVTVEAAPVPDFVSDVNSGCAPTTITFTNNTVGSDNCEWNFGDGTTLVGCGPVTHVYGAAGIYDVTLTMESANGCQGTTTINDMILIEALPVASFFMDPIELSLLSPVGTFINETTGASNYAWNFGDGSPGTSEINPEHTFPGVQAGDYLVTLVASTPGGCVDSATLIIHVKDELLYFIPNTFTPDGNEMNNTFKPVFTAGYNPEDYRMMIFNRWGEVIFESRDADFGWDGTYQGVMRDEGIYTWRIEFSSSETDERIIITGHVNLLK